MNDTHDPLPADDNKPLIALAYEAYMKGREHMRTTRKAYESAQLKLGPLADAYYALVELPPMDETKPPAPLPDHVAWYALDNLIAVPIVAVFGLGLWQVAYDVWEGLAWLFFLVF